MSASLIPEQLYVFIIALVLDVFLGDPPNRWHPVAWMGRFISWLEKPTLPNNFFRFIQGAVIVVLGTAIWTTPVVLLINAVNRWGLIPGILIQAVLLTSTISYSGLVKAASQVMKALEKGDLEESQRLVSWHLVSRKTESLDASQVAAAAVESVAENITDGITAPLLYFLLLGAPGAWAFRFINTCDSMLGYRDSRYEYLGKFAARLDDLLNWIPARITAVLIALAAWVGKESYSNAWHVMRQQHKRTASPNAGWTMSAMAGALNVTLEKVGHYSLVGGDEPVSAATIERSTRLSSFTVLILSLLLSAILLVSGIQ
ncbi:MAG: cobalamin biosynthesis protein [Anaerolineales bacterium]|nr:cobalamin biosynthesis protein [Anaerolineales bacterium]